MNEIILCRTQEIHETAETTRHLLAVAYIPPSQFSPRYPHFILNCFQDHTCTIRNTPAFWSIWPIGRESMGSGRKAGKYETIFTTMVNAAYKKHRNSKVTVASRCFFKAGVFSIQQNRAEWRSTRPGTGWSDGARRALMRHFFVRSPPTTHHGPTIDIVKALAIGHENSA
jgi:hypothetical protein